MYRFKLHFDKDTSEEIEKRKKVAKTTPLVTVKEVITRESLLYLRLGNFHVSWVKILP